MAMYVMVTADFPGVTSEQREEIYACLKEMNWQKIQNVGRDISTAWQAQFEDSLPASQAILSSIDEFASCSKPYTKPRLVLHAGPNKPTVY